MKNFIALTIILLAALTAKISYAQKDTLKPYQTETIDVTAEYKGMKVIQTPYSIGILDSMEFRRNNGIHLTSSLNLVPGIRFEMRTATSGTRLTIRGYGNSTNFNGTGYKAYLNGIPLTDADGTTTLDDIDFTTLGKVELIKGPASSLYGMNIGGVLNMQTEKAPLGVSLRQDIIGGRYGLWRTNTFAEIGTEKSNLLINYGHQNYDGFRSHGNSKKDFLTINGDVQTDARGKLSFYFNYTNSRDYLAGEQDSLSFANNYGAPDPDYVRHDAHIFIESERAGMSYDYKITNNFSNITSVFAGGFNQDQPIGAGRVTRTDKTKFGGRTVFNFNSEIGKFPVKILFGGEFLKNITFSPVYQLDNTVNIISTFSDIEVKPSSFNTFLQGEIDVTPTTNIVAGASLNFLEYEINDMLRTTGHKDASGYKRFDPIVTPRFSVRQMITPDISLYGSYSEGYQAPTTGQVVVPQLGNGAVLYDLKPEHARSFEFGTKGNVLQHKLNYEVAFFTMNVTDKLVTQFTDGVSSAVNAGKVRFTGVETQLSYNYYLPNSPVSLIRPFVTYAYSDFKYIDFTTYTGGSNKTYNDNQVVGVPKNLINAGLDFETTFGAYLYSTFTFTDKIPVTNANDHYAESYSLLNMKAGYRKMVSKAIMLDAFIGSDNVTDTRYASMLFLNPNDNHYFLAGAPRTFYGGVSLRYTIQ